ncbi:hypothetical protein NIES46_48110 [Arthrospira platensis NIES-46]|uniref:Uncharacterized protein n=1 Tax=Limnospira platensis NIES-46 TaxID=1236695 RepID=A0A5M3TFB5_LIMPL|nr:hypothetical protein NIES46_48110 [Arthrospira platensis NIES-46]
MTAKHLIINGHGWVRLSMAIKIDTILLSKEQGWLQSERFGVLEYYRVNYNGLITILGQVYMFMTLYVK